jgi:hypothetical protein
METTTMDFPFGLVGVAVAKWLLAMVVSVEVVVTVVTEVSVVVT